jgi:hypothetical protein
MPIDPTTKHTLYNEYADQWQQNVDFAEMRKSVLDEGTYLDRWGDDPKEVISQYNLRKKMSMTLDLSPDLIEMRLTELFRVAPKRSFEESPYKAQIERFLENVDTGGTSMDAFMRRSSKMMLVNGIDILVDKTVSEIEPLTAMDENTLPFLSGFGPLERYDWAVDHAGRYIWVMYFLGEEAAQEPGDESEGVKRYVLYTRDSVTVYSVDSDGNQTSETRPHTMGLVPVVQLYWGRSIHVDQKAIAISLMDELAPLARYMLNLVSQGQFDLYMTVAFFVAIGLTPDEVSSAVGAGIIKTIPIAEGDFKPIVTQVDHIKEKGAWIDRLMLTMMRKGKLLGLNASLEGRASSGVQVMVEASPLHSELSSVADMLGAADQEIVRLAISRVEGKPITLDELGYTAVYNKVYTLQSPKALIEEAKQLMDVAGIEEVSSLGRLQFRKILDVLARPGSKEHKEALEQLEAFNGTSIIPSLPPVEDGDE